MFEHIGLHVNTTLNGIDTLLKDWKPPLIVILDHSVDVWQEVRDACPDTIIVGRVVLPHEPDYSYGMDTTNIALQLRDIILPMAERMDGIVDYWCMDNEPVVGNNASDIDNMKRLSEVTCKWVELMKPFRPCVGNFSVGNPRLSFWAEFLPALYLASECGGVLGLHEYNWPEMWVTPYSHNDPIWYCNRHEQVFYGNEQLRHDDPNVGPLDYWDGLPPCLRSLLFAITECGLDGMVMEPEEGPHGWEGHIGAGLYLNQLEWYNQTLKAQTYVLGAAIYCACADNDPQWGSYNMYPSPINHLVEHATPISRRLFTCL